MDAQRWVYVLVIAVSARCWCSAVALLVRRVRALRERRAPYEVDAAAPDVELAGDVLDGATPALREGVRRAAQVLEDEVPPGDAVIAAWVALEASAERSGLVRDRAQTATEFTVEVLDATRADPRGDARAARAVPGGAVLRARAHARGRRRRPGPAWRRSRTT